MRDAAKVAQYRGKAIQHLGAFASRYKLPYMVEYERCTATILTLRIDDQGDIVSTLTWTLDGEQQNHPDGAVQTWRVTNPPVYRPDPGGDVMVNGIRCTHDPIGIAREALGEVIKIWSGGVL